MANASKHRIGAGSQGKGAGSGAMTDLQDEELGANEVLSNRDKSRHSDQRGLDSKSVQVEQLQDSSASHEIPGRDAQDATGNRAASRGR